MNVLPDELLIEIFLFNPNINTLDLIENRAIALKELDKIESALSLLFRWKRDMREIRAIDIVEMASKENNIDVVRYLITTLNNEKFTEKTITIAARYGRRELVNTLITETTNKNLVAFDAAEGGHKEIVMDMITLGASSYLWIAKCAAKGGHKEIVDEMLKRRYYWDLDNLACCAAESGNHSLVNSIIAAAAEDGRDFSTDDYRTIAASAAKGGHKEIVYDMIKLKRSYRTGKLIKGGANNWEEIANNAAFSGSLELLETMINDRRDQHCNIIKGYRDWNQIATHAARGGHKKIVNFAIKRGANCFDDIAENAALTGNKEIVDDMYERGVDDWNSISYNASVNGHVEIVMDAIRLGASNYNVIAKHAIGIGCKELVYSMMELGAFNHKVVAKIAAEKGYKYVVEQMAKRSKKIKVRSLNFDHHADSILYFKQ